MLIPNSNQFYCSCQNVEPMEVILTSSNESSISVSTSYQDTSITIDEKNNATSFNRTYCTRVDIMHVLTEDDPTEVCEEGECHRVARLFYGCHV
mmetsp:Transcript_10859/g.23917  ORF Transcript_10859/g.23917 Transcript_10859/m.23917 type:complete len:94 (-) Transcript_10859:888-1169(-)